MTELRVEKSRNPLRHLLEPRFWWLAAKTVWLKLQHSRRGNDNYLDHLHQFYNREDITPHIAYYGDAYADVRPQLADLADMPPGASVLDVATGMGHQAVEFAQRGHPVVAGDLIHRRASATGSSHVAVRPAVHDAARLPFKDNSFDLVTTSLMIHNMPLDVQMRTLAEFRRVARQRVAIVEPRPRENWFLRHLYANIGQVLDESLYFRDFMLRDFDAHLEEAGLRVVARERALQHLLVIYVCEPV